MTNSVDMNAFAISLQRLTQVAQATKNAKNIISKIISSTFFLDVMRDAAMQGDSSANLLSFNDSSIIAFTGDDETTTTWRIILDGVWDDDYCRVHNLSEFVRSPSFQMALTDAFPLPFEVNVWEDCVKIKW